MDAPDFLLGGPTSDAACPALKFENGKPTSMQPHLFMSEFERISELKKKVNFEKFYSWKGSDTLLITSNVNSKVVEL